MRKILTIIFALIALVHFSYGQVTSICYGVEDNTFLPDFTNCSNYYACVNDVAYMQTCPPGYLFNGTLQACADASQVLCTVCPSGIPDITFLAVDGVCDKFVICGGGYPFLQTCNDGLEYNSATGKCDYPSNVDCPYRPPKCSTVNSTNQLVFLTELGICNQYTICFNGIGYGQTCASGLVFNPNVNSCVLSATYSCPY